MRISRFFLAGTKSTLVSELYTSAANVKNKITDINSVRWAKCLSGRFLYIEIFFEKYFCRPEHSGVVNRDMGERGNKNFAHNQLGREGGEL